MKLKKCPEHNYTMKENCKICGKKTEDAHYKFIKIKSIKEINQKSIKKFNSRENYPIEMDNYSDSNS